jgi:hypothetical protein
MTLSAAAHLISVMAGLDPAIHALTARAERVVDARITPGTARKGRLSGGQHDNFSEER